jgi:hypothetical protein
MREQRGKSSGERRCSGKARIAGKDDAEQLFAIEVFAREDAQLAEHSIIANIC